MRTVFAALCVVVVVGFGCASTDNQRQPAGTIPFEIAIETSEPGSRIELDGEYLGLSPLTVTVYGDKDGTFHGAGDGHTTFRAYPVKPGQFIQTKSFLNGAQSFMFGQQDRIPRRLFFDLNQKTEELQIVAPR